MREFVKRVVQKLPKLLNEQALPLFNLLATEYEKLDAVIESLSTGLLICDDKWNMLQANKAACRYLSINQKNGSEQFVWEVIEDTEIAAFLHTSWMRQKRITSEEFTLDSAGSPRFVTVCTMPLVQKKKIIGNIIKIDDITEKRNQEILLHRMENLASLTNLAATVAHEIKNPLGSISIHIQLIQKLLSSRAALQNTIPDATDLKIRTYLDVVNEEVERLNRIIVDFLFAVRPINADLHMTDIHTIIEELVNFFKLEFDQGHVIVELILLKNAPLLLLDERLIKQALINLMKNALGAMPNGGSLCIATKIRDDGFVLTIADTGYGMSEETISYIFEPYFTTKANGTGLGLTLVYKIITEHRGDIEVHSLEGEGTVFTLTFPIPQTEKRLLEYVHISKENNI